MAIDNLISITLTAQEVETINTAINSLNAVLADKVINLTPNERRQYGSIADRNKILVDKCKAYMEQNPHTIPSILDKAEFDRDYKARALMEDPIRRLNSVIEKLQDTKTLLDHDNYHAAVSYYRYIKYLSTQNEPGTTTVYQDLQLHYKRLRTISEAPQDNTTKGE